jgi:hypothetical protein
MTSTPEARGVPMIGPSPSMPTIPSTIARCGRTVAVMSRIDPGMPAWCRTFFGQPVIAPRHHAEEFFIESVTPAQWWVLSLGSETIRSARTSVAGRASRSAG